MVAKLQARVLARNEQMRRLAKGGESMSNWTEFDGLGTRSYDERDTILAQFTPWLRRMELSPNWSIMTRAL
jgi:hypothetical protein